MDKIVCFDCDMDYPNVVMCDDGHCRCEPCAEVAAEDHGIFIVDNDDWGDQG